MPASDVVAPHTFPKGDDALPCIACLFRLSEGADVRSLIDTHRELRNPPNPGLLRVAAGHALTKGSFVTVDVYATADDLMATAARIEANEAMRGMVAATLDFATARMWLGPVGDLPDAFHLESSRDRLSTVAVLHSDVASSVEMTSSTDSSNDPSVGAYTARHPPCPQRPQENVGVSGVDFAMDGRTSNSSTAAQPASPPPEEAASDVESGGSGG
eukprot:CAMPEP_0174856592 /NCGR_PEP_ID=MMETSP1114-20130205/36119_1 /TAXON_ID=312471 /ORGANISM="Neobodo designis, Strain CCAP 1951/1" /LENGTH=214 /DNA_ID=CAMNT_0016091395 /DNA_START=75 /DNA_END=715 /DNA_ORIENTATION=+